MNILAKSLKSSDRNEKDTHSEKIQQNPKIYAKNSKSSDVGKKDPPTLRKLR